MALTDRGGAGELRDYLDPAQAPATAPDRARMSAATRELHDGVDAAIQRHRQPYLHPDGETLQLDLFGSEPLVQWQERKSSAIFLSAEAWAQMPQIYGRYGTETGRSLLGEVCALEHAAGAVLTDGGMQACALLFDVLLTPGSHAVVTRSIYNKAKAYLQRLAARIGAEVTLVDDGLQPLAAAIRADTVLLFTETYSNPLLRAADPVALGELGRTARAGDSKRLRVIVDNTVATPWALRRPLLEVPGIDFVVASGTKALAGADRDMWGYIAANHIELLNELMDLQAMRGGILDWRRARAVLDGLASARERFEQRCATARQVAAFLAAHPRVAEVFHPSLPGHPDATTIAEHYRLHGSLMSFRLRDADEAATRHFCDVLAMSGIVRYALSFDGLTTKLNHHRSVSEYFTAAEEVKRIGVDRLVRLGVGIEAADDLVACLNWALWHAPAIAPDAVVDWQRQRRLGLGLPGASS